MLRKCCDCKEEKECTIFSSRSHRCKPCSVIAVREWRKKNPGKRTDSGAAFYALNKEREHARSKVYRKRYRETITKKNREWQKANPEKMKKYYRKSRLKKQYGLTVEQYENILTSQNKRCAICFSEKPSPRRMNTSFAVDHCHTTGKIRGLLCSDCNISLGKFKDDPEVLRRAASYIETYQ